MIDLHTHTFFSDGALAPSELVRRAQHRGLTGIALTDHGDTSNIDFIIPRIVAVAADLNRILTGIRVVPGIEITHVPPALIAEAAKTSRALGARIIVVHGETISEPVAPGTNAAALAADVDVLAHPGLLTVDLAETAARRGILLEITARQGHCLANGRVARLALAAGAGMVVNTDAHAPGDLIDADFALSVVRGAGLTEADFHRMQENAAAFL
jgi:histidinol phosphatase-like PHP family hydrolase